MRKLLIIAAFPLLAHADEAMIEEAKAAISKSFKDPYSAVFENITIGKAADGTPVVCGTVNAKNSYGAYTGRKPFYYTVKAKIGDIDQRGDDVVRKALCG